MDGLCSTVFLCTVMVCSPSPLQPEVRVRVNDTQVSQVTYWSLEKFESRLEQMRELYAVSNVGPIVCIHHPSFLLPSPLSSPSQSQMPSSSASLELAESVISTGSDDTDPFHDPTDTWYPDTLATPKSSPQRHLIRSFSAASSRSTTPRSNTHSTRRILDLTSSVPVSSVHVHRSRNGGEQGRPVPPNILGGGPGPPNNYSATLSQAYAIQ